MGILLFILVQLVLAKTPSDSFFDPTINYGILPGRVTDRDSTGSTLKIQSESHNVKFFRSGDTVEFILSNGESRGRCLGYVRDVEENYFVMDAKEITKCWHNDSPIRRGAMLTLYSTSLENRIKDASQYRSTLVARKDHFLRQLNEVNNFLYSFEEKKALVAAEYDRKMVELNKAKQDALDQMLIKRKNSLVLQKEMALRLDQLDRDIEDYRIENQELHVDRWHLDRDLGLPVGSRPQAMRE